MYQYFYRHLQVFFQTLGELFRSPSATLLGSLMIGITIAIPTLSYIGLNSAQTLANTWDIQPQINLYLDKDSNNDSTEALREEIGFIEGVDSTRLISKKEALEQFKIASGLSEELDSLNDNPLPDTLIVSPSTEFLNETKIKALTESILKFEGIESHSINFEWLSRFDSIIRFGRSLFFFLTCLLSIAIVLVIHNTISLLINNRKQEIIVTQLVGGTNAFIKRPFLYYGAMLGFFGAIAGLIIYFGSSILIERPITELANSYGSQFSLPNLSFKEAGSILLLSTLLGWLAAQFSLFRQLHRIKPQ